MIVLIGFMGAGKTTVARLLGARLGLPYIDTDSLVEEEGGTSIADLFASEGEEHMRALERSVVARVLAGSDAVVSLGGGAVTDADNRSRIGEHTVVWLDVPVEEALDRVGDTASRPLLTDRDPVALEAERRALYEDAATFKVDTSARAPHEVAAEIAQRVSGDRTAGTRTIRVAAGAGYEVTVGSGVSSAGLEGVQGLDRAEKALLVTHPELVPMAAKVHASLAERGLEVIEITFPAGESSKSTDTVNALYERFAAENAHRHDLVVAFGGGVVGDVAGFVASTYVRGMPLVQIPTTLLAQVDAAIGGKTGVNLATGKNLVGTIHQPAAVICDVDHLAGCSEDELRSGLAEVLKYGFIADPSILDLVEAGSDRILAADPSVLVEVVARSVAVKASIVATDETERGDRAFLNYGHTFAHAIETVTGYDRYRHGEAVALGMMAAAYTSAGMQWIPEGLVDLHRRALSNVGLPVSGRFDHGALAEAWRQDKKYARGTRFVLLRGLAQPVAGVTVTTEVLGDALGRLAREDVTR